MRRTSRLDPGGRKLRDTTLAVRGEKWGQKADAIKWLQTAYRLHDNALPGMKVDPLLDPIRDTPEYKDIERQLNFPPK